MNFEQNYTTELPYPIKKVYYDNSQYARILVLTDGQYFVHKITTGVYFPVPDYLAAKGLRRMIVDRCSGIDYELERDRS